MASNLIKCLLLEFSSSALTGSYQNFGAAITNPAIKIMFINTSSVDVYITDGVGTFHVPSKLSVTFDENFQDDKLALTRYHAPNGTQYQIKQVTGAGAGTTDIIGHIIVER